MVYMVMACIVIVYAVMACIVMTGSEKRTEKEPKNNWKAKDSTENHASTGKREAQRCAKTGENKAKGAWGPW